MDDLRKSGIVVLVEMRGVDERWRVSLNRETARHQRVRWRGFTMVRKKDWLIVFLSNPQQALKDYGNSSKVTISNPHNPWLFVRQLRNIRANLLRFTYTNPTTITT